MNPQAGFKDLTRENFLQPDEVQVSFVWRQPTGEVRPQTAHEWAGMILGIRLNNSVPQGVRDLFAVARGAIVYGYFFYPLYALASEQLFRVGEAAIGAKATTVDAPEDLVTFKARLDWLAKAGAISGDEMEVWHDLRDLRNMASHPTEQTILTPVQALNTLTRLAEVIHELFDAGDRK